MLDPSSGRPVNHWEFSDLEEITIGRSPEQKIEVCDPYVSRHHASLVFREGQWLLQSFGRNGVLIANQHVKEHSLEDGMQFRMGVEGPILKFMFASDTYSIGATVNFDSDELNYLLLDNLQVEKDVEEVTDGEYFQKIQRLAKEMRGKSPD